MYGFHCLSELRTISVSVLMQIVVAAALSGTAAQPSEIKDCETCPTMVVVPAGSFVMGSTAEERTREKVPSPPKVPFDFAQFEQPRREVVFQKPFAIGKYEVSRGEYARFVAETDYPSGPKCWAWDSTSDNYDEMAGWVVQEGKSWRDPGVMI